MAANLERASAAPAKAGDAYFDNLLTKALLRKKLFKEYLSRHQVMERLNQAVEALYDCDVLPEEPIQFIASHIKAPAPGSRPTSANVKSSSVQASLREDGNVPRSHVTRP